VDASRLVYYGRSLGTGVAAQVAAKRSPAAIILESPFTSVASFASGFGVPPFIMRHPFRTDRALPPLAASGIRPPAVLILHSPTDEIIPFAHALRLQALMPSANLVEIAGGHYASPLAQSAYEVAIHDFLAKAGLR